MSPDDGARVSNQELTIQQIMIRATTALVQHRLLRIQAYAIARRNSRLQVSRRSNRDGVPLSYWSDSRSTAQTPVAPRTGQESGGHASKGTAELVKRKLGG